MAFLAHYSALIGGEVGDNRITCPGHGHPLPHIQIIDKAFEICGNQSPGNSLSNYSTSINMISQIIQMNAARLRGLFKFGRASTVW